MKQRAEDPEAKPPTRTARRLRDLARHRLADRALREPEPEFIERLRTEGNCIIGGPGGYIVLPAESD